MNKNQKFMKEYEHTLREAELKAYSKISLQRPLTTTEFTRYKTLFNQVAE